MMQRYAWPGNIRQLENMIRELRPDRQRRGPGGGSWPRLRRPGSIPEIDLANPISLKEITKAATQDLEREIMLKVLQVNGWSRRKTAKWLNISYRSLLYKLQESQGRVTPGQPLNAKTGPAKPLPPQDATTQSDVEQLSA